MINVLLSFVFCLASCAAAIAGGSSGPGVVVQKSPVLLSPPPGYPVANLLLDDQFSTLNSATWSTYMQDNTGAWLDGGNLTLPQSSEGNAGGYFQEFEDPGQVSTAGSDGLTITAVPDSSHSGLGYNWKSGVINSYGKFTFTGGYAQARMKSPDVTTGAWPAFWHLTNGSTTNEIDTQEGGFLVTGHNPNQIIASDDHFTTNNQIFTDVGKDLSADYHVYGMEYVPGVSIRYFLDGVQTGIMTTNIQSSAENLIFILGVASSAASFHSQTSGATPASLVMKVSEVQVYSLPTTNLIRNPVNAGSPATGIPGTLPTNWSIFQGTIALSTEFEGFGWATDPYTGQQIATDTIRIFGTPAATGNLQIFFDSAAPIGVVSAVESSWIALAPGSSKNNVGNIALNCDANTSIGGYISTPLSVTLGSGSVLPLSTTLTRAVATATMPATTAQAACYWAMAVTSGSAVDLTLTIGGVQLEESQTVVHAWVP
jgi:hypothetical protein